MPSALFHTRRGRGSIVGLTALAVVLLAIVLGTANRAEAFSKDYCGYAVPTGWECRHGNYNSITYNRSQAAYYGNNNCVYMITAAGNLRGKGAIVCDNNSDGMARMCVTSATPMSEGRTFVTSATDTLYGVVNNVTYDSGCAV